MNVTTHRIVIPRRERIAGTWEYKIVGEDHVIVHLEIDVEQIAAQLGRKAWRNKSKRAVLGHELVTVEVRRAP